jgi:hypothetical protein
MALFQEHFFPRPISPEPNSPLSEEYLSSDELSEGEDEQLSRRVIDVAQPQAAMVIMPYVQQILRESPRAEDAERRGLIHALRRIPQHGNRADIQTMVQISNMIQEATARALLDHDAMLARQRHETSLANHKKNTALIAAGASTAVAFITGAVTLAVHFSPSCDQ